MFTMDELTGIDYNTWCRQTYRTPDSHIKSLVEEIAIYIDRLSELRAKRDSVSQEKWSYYVDLVIAIEAKIKHKREELELVKGKI